MQDKPDAATRSERSLQFWPTVVLTAMMLWVGQDTSNFLWWNYLPDGLSSSTAYALQLGMYGLGTLLTIAGLTYFWRRRTRHAGVSVPAAVILFALITAMFDVAHYVGTTPSAEDILPAAEEHAGESIYELTADDMVNYSAIKGRVAGNTVIRTGNKR
jgi:hypothetical protein